MDDQSKSLESRARRVTDEEQRGTTLPHSSLVTQGGRGNFRSDFLDCWERLPNKSLFFGILVVWLALFQFLGNSTFGYVDTASLFHWMANAYAAGNLYLLPRLFHEPVNVLQRLLAGDEAHGFFIPLVVVALLWWKRKELLAVRLQAWWPGLLWIAGALVLHIVGYLVQQPRLSIIALFTGIYGLMGLAWGPGWLRASFFPFFLFVFAVPLSVLAESVTFPLRLLVTKIVAFICQYLLAIDVSSEGTRLIKRPWGYEYEVAAACSGIRSLVAITAIAVIYAFMFFRVTWERALLIFSAAPLAVVGNTLRLLAIVFAAEWHGQEGGNKMHESDLGGLLPYVPVVVGLILIGRWLENRAADRPATDGGVRRQPTTI